MSLNSPEYEAPSEGTIKAVKTEEEYPVEVKFEDDMQELWTLKKFAKEVKKGTVQLMR